MIILHNGFDKDSRDFLAAVLAAFGTTLDAYAGGVAVSDDGRITVYDWYVGGREAWWVLTGTDKVSALPSVVVDVPTYDIPEQTIDGETIPGRTVAAVQVAVRKPRDLADVQAYLDETNVLLARSKDQAGKPTTPAVLTLETMNDAATGRSAR